VREALRVTIALTLGALLSAVALSVLLIVLTNMNSGQSLATDVSPQRVFWSSIAFCLFTIPIVFAFGAPLYLLYRRLHLLRVWICALTGGVIAISFPYAFRLLGADVSLPWRAILWFGVSGAVGGALMGALVRHQAIPKPVSQL
jgi:hypothetical protein